MTPCELAQYGITREAVLNAMDEFSSYGGLCAMFRFDVQCSVVCAVLSELGGISHWGWYWPTPRASDTQSANQRALMLAFLYEWTEE